MIGLREATVPSKPGRDNEDYFGAAHRTLVLLDGAGTPAGSESGCIHGVAWFARTLGAQLLHLANPAQGLPLSDALAEAIHSVGLLHADTCDLQHPGTPSSTVIVARDLGAQWDYLVLADSTLMFIRLNGVNVITDDREAQVGRQLRQAMDALPSGSPAHTQAHRQYVEALRAHRNRAGGFWVASTDASAADQAITGTVDATDIEAVALLSDGASRLADRFGLMTWDETAAVLLNAGPDNLISRVREAEGSDPEGLRWPRGKATDDATAAVAQLTR